MVGWSVLGRITAAATWKTKALEFAVEKMAEPVVRMAAGRAFSRVKVALLEPGSNRRAAPARIWRLPPGSVRNLSSGKILVPAEAFPAPRWARSRKQSRQGKKRKRAKEMFAAKNKIELQRGLRASAPFPTRIVSKFRGVNLKVRSSSDQPANRRPCAKNTTPEDTGQASYSRGWRAVLIWVRSLRRTTPLDGRGVAQPG